MNTNITPTEIRKMNMADLYKLAQAVRERIINVTSIRGGHLAPSLGVVELTIALHYAFNTPSDKIIWDVGHQSYAHKLITGRWEKFDTLRTYQGIAGFPKQSESEFDTFDTGHSGNSISVALGITTAVNLKKQSNKTIAVIGDGSIVTGMSFEALNYAGDAHQNLIVVLNDNEMSIGKSTGAMARYFSRMITGRMYNKLKTDTWNLLGLLPQRLSGRARLAARKLEEGLKNLIAPSIIFEEMGFRYLGPFNGHNLDLLIDTFKRVKNIRGPVLVHVVTKKGKGYEPAEKDPEIFHGVGPFQKLNGTTDSSKLVKNCCDVFGDTLIELAEKDERICAISAGMCLGTGLAEFKKRFPERFFDVGICEQHAVTFAAGLALKGLRPVVAIYSTFLARAYDQIIQDVALQNLPVIFAVDRAGIVGEDGPTHHGNFDISYLRIIPNLTIGAPKDSQELTQMFKIAVQHHGPFVIRYPRGTLNACTFPNQQHTSEFDIRSGFSNLSKPISDIGKAEILYQNQKINGKPTFVILAIGSMVNNTYEAVVKLVDTGKVKACNLTLVNMRFVKPYDENLLTKLITDNATVITIEENTLAGGFGSSMLEFLEIKGIKTRQIVRFGLVDKFIEQGKRDELLDRYGLSVEQIKKRIEQILTKLTNI